MKLLKEYNQYLANLAVMNIKLHNIHWNVVGMQFVAVHEFTEAVYDELFEYFDAVAEYVKMFGAVPDSRMADYLNNATVKEVEAKKFSESEAITIVKADLEALREEAIALRNASDEEGWFSAVAMFEDQVEYYNKQIWFLSSMLNK